MKIEIQQVDNGYITQRKSSKSKIFGGLDEALKDIRNEFERERGKEPVGFSISENGGRKKEVE